MVTLVARPDIAACPVSAMRAYLLLRLRGQPQDFLFIRGKSTPLTTRALARALCEAGRLSHMDVSRLAGHCFRIGGASHGAQHGMFELQLCVAGRWASSAVRRYLRQPISLLQINPASDGVG